MALQAGKRYRDTATGITGRATSISVDPEYRFDGATPMPASGAVLDLDPEHRGGDIANGRWYVEHRLEEVADDPAAKAG